MIISFTLAFLAYKNLLKQSYCIMNIAGRRPEWMSCLFSDVVVHASPGNVLPSGAWTLPGQRGSVFQDSRSGIGA